MKFTFLFILGYFISTAWGTRGGSLDDIKKFSDCLLANRQDTASSFILMAVIVMQL